MQSTVKEGRRQGRQRKRWEDNIGEWAGLEFAKSKRAVENSEKNDKTDCKIICGASTTLVVKELMMMMMMMIMMIMTFTFTYPLTAGVVGVPQMTSQPVFYIFLGSPLLSWT